MDAVRVFVWRVRISLLAVALALIGMGEQGLSPLPMLPERNSASVASAFSTPEPDDERPLAAVAPGAAPQAQPSLVQVRSFDQECMASKPRKVSGLGGSQAGEPAAECGTTPMNGDARIKRVLSAQSPKSVIPAARGVKAPARYAHSEPKRARQPLKVARNGLGRHAALKRWSVSNNRRCEATCPIRPLACSHDFVSCERPVPA